MYLQKGLLSEVSICDNDFTIDSYAVSVEVLSKSKLSVYEFISNKEYYWLRDYENLSHSLKGELLPYGFLRCDAAFVRNSKNCSNGSLDIVIIESNKFMVFNTDIKEWKSPQSLNSDQMFSHIIAHMNESIQINAITDWEQNRLIIFQNKNYFIIEWMSTCDAINGIGIKTYPLFDTSQWFENRSIDSSFLLTVPKEEQNSSDILYLFSGRYCRTMTVTGFDSTNGQIIGDLKPIEMEKFFLCLPTDPTLMITKFITTKRSEGGIEANLKSHATTDSEIDPFLPILGAIVVFAIVLIALLILIPKES
jgi:hypothetical protein